uniref:Uncharacterized protein n=1 Tax=Arundo donax TaxID=35708 RepID=A0A0A9CKB4_ARUDO
MLDGKISQAGGSHSARAAAATSPSRCSPPPGDTTPWVSAWLGLPSFPSWAHDLHHVRVLYHFGYISYDTFRCDSVPCSCRGTSY